jgi:predicted Rossmann-fold nucleotide-binding protein
MTLVIVCGGRDYDDVEHVYAEMDKILIAKPDLFVIHGGASGADELAGDWAMSRGVPQAAVPAIWEYYGKRAGPMRNGWMLRLRPNGVVAFPGGAGTANMCRQAEAAGVPVMHIMSPKPQTADTKG